MGGLLVMLLAAYANSFRVPFLMDDDDSIAANPSIRSFSTALFPPMKSGVTVSGRPLLNLSLAVNYRLHGTEVWGYHALNLLIHFCAASCLFGVVRRTLLGLAAGAKVSARPAVAPCHGKETLLAWAVAALWALHPMQTESVTYVIQRAESLVGLCYLFTLYAFIRGAGEASRGWLAASCAGCWLGMAAKEVMATAPLMVLLYDRIFLAGTFREAWAKRRWVYVAMACSWLLLLGLLVASGGRGNTVGTENMAWWEYAMTQATGVVGYLGKAVVPVNLVFDYGIVMDKRPGWVAGGAVSILALLGVAGRMLWRRNGFGFLGAWVFVILAPSSTVVPISSQTLAEHRMYLPLAGVVVAAVLLVQRWAGRLAPGVFLVLGVAAAAGTWDRNRDYRSALTLWEDTLQKVPYNLRAMTVISLERLKRGENEEALAVLERAVKMYPNNEDARASHGFALLRVGLGAPPEDNGGPGAGSVRPVREADMGMVRRALAELRAASELSPATVEVIAGSLKARAKQACEAGRPEVALVLLETAVGLAPEFFEARLLQGETLLGLGRAEEGLSHLRAAVRLRPDDVAALQVLVEGLAGAGANEEAAVVCERLVRLAPSAEAWTYLGALQARRGRIEAARDAFVQALRLDPTHLHARENLAKAEEMLKSMGSR